MDEYINRKAIDFPWLASGKIIDGELYVRIDEIYEEVKKLPAFDVVPVRHGKWVSDGDGGIYCSECNRRPTLLAQTDYCPKCGAKMDGGEKE